jgi:hypothetical protein
VQHALHARCNALVIGEPPRAGGCRRWLPALVFIFERFAALDAGTSCDDAWPEALLATVSQDAVWELA